MILNKINDYIRTVILNISILSFLFLFVTIKFTYCYKHHIVNTFYQTKTDMFILRSQKSKCVSYPCNIGLRKLEDLNSTILGM